MKTTGEKGREAPRRKSGRGPGLVPAVFLSVVSALALSLAFSGVILVFQLRIQNLAEETRDTVLPSALERHRTVVNIERLGRYGDLVLSSNDKEERRSLRLTAQVLAQDSAYETEPGVQAAVWETYLALSDVVDKKNSAEELMDDARADLTELDKAVDALILPIPPQLSRPHVLLEGLLRLFYQIRVVLARAMTANELKEIDRLTMHFNELAAQAQQRVDTLAVLDPGTDLAQAAAMLAEARKIFLSRQTAVKLEYMARARWFKATTSLENSADSLSTDAASTTAASFSTIGAFARDAAVSSLIGLTGLMALLTILGILIRRHIVLPIMRATRGLVLAEETQGPVSIEGATIREMDAMVQAVERFGAFHAQIAERTRELEREVAQRKRAEVELKKAKETAEAASRAKSEFLASMSHEIRTPLNSILGMADLLQNTPLTSEQHRYVKFFSSAGQNLLSVINDILDLSRVEAGRIDLAVEPFDPLAVVENTCKLMAPKAHEKGVELVFSWDRKLPAAFLGDEERVRQVLSNLVSNAVKFTHEGWVEVRLDYDPEGGGLCFTVRDTGIGVPLSKRRIIFDSFTQSDSSLTRRYGGTGLGLAIAKRLTEHMGGRISVRDAQDGGSIFSFNLSLEPVPAASHKAPGGGPEGSRQQPLEGLKVAVVGGTEISRGSAVASLLSLGAEPHAYANGDGAVDALDKAGAGEAPFRLAIVFIDAKGRGKETAARLFERNRPGLTTAVAMPAHADKNLVARLRDLGAGEFLIMPLTRPELVELMRTALNRTDAKTERAKELPPPKARVLVADDNASNRVVVELFFRDSPVELAFAEDGATAVEMAIKERFDAIFMDIEMPGMNGFEATHAIRNAEAEAGLPPTAVIALTAHAFEEHRERCLNAGFDDFLAKPVGREELYAALERALSSRVSPAEGSGAKVPRATIKAELRPIVPGFMESTRMLVSELRKAVDKTDFDEARRLSHSVKGSSATYGLDELSEMAKRAEEAAQLMDGVHLSKEAAAMQDYLEKVVIDYGK